jgi:hypothetical protein
MAAFSWTPGRVTKEQTVADFLDVFYGNEVSGMGEMYGALQECARFFEQSLERLPSTIRGPAYGYSDAKRPVGRTDRTLKPPALPNADDLSIEPVFRQRYRAALAEAPARLAENDRLVLRLHENIARAKRNRYNLEVLLSIAYFTRHFIDLLLGLAAAEDLLVRAAETAREDGGREDAMRLVARARDRVQGLIDERGRVFARLKATWEKSTLPKNAPVDGKDFVHVMDDVKDHFADRRADLSYLIAPEENIGLEAWLDELDRRTAMKQL